MSSMTRKSMLVAALAVAAVLACASVALAAHSSPPPYPTWGTISLLPGNSGQPSPHGAYTTTTVKCVVCHAVHNAAVGGDILLQTTASDACNYCHVNTLSSYTQVYNSNPAYYSTGGDLANAHNSYGSPEQGVTCARCHQVHAATNAMTYSTYLSSKLLKGPKTAAGADPVAGPVLASDTNTWTAMTKWCAGCHYGEAGTYNYYSTAYNDATHIMTTATANYANPAASISATRVAFGNSNYCSSCHGGGFGTSNWPHYVAGAQRFLLQADGATGTVTGAALARQDGVCLRCHKNGAADGTGIRF